MARRPDPRKADQGRRAHHAGLAAEDAVAGDYARRGHRERARRWRGQAGELDLVVDDGDGVIFVEVKQSRDFARAASHVSPRQLERIFASATEYVGRMPRGLLTDMRIDLALVDGQGRIEIIENAFAA